MGNILRCLWRDCCNPQPLDEESLPPHGVAPATAGFSALARDLLHFEVTAQVPQGLSQHVQSSRKAQANWYKKLLEAWKEAKPPPRNAEEASRLILETLQRHRKADVQGLLSFYGLPYPAASVEVPGEIPVPQKWPKGVKYELHTLQVDARAIADGDTITVYVDTKNPRESAAVPMSVVEAMMQRRKARMKRDFERADALQKEISDAGYRVWDAPKHGEGEDILAHKYRIRLRGVDAPESKMPYGKQAKEALLNLIEGKCLHILVYDEDRYGRTVGDVFCDGVFIQEVLLKKGWVWHYTQYDQRPEFALWEQEARAARIGLWASSNPQKPWEWRKDKREGG